MAQPTNTFDSYDVVGIKEDLSDVIHDLSPDDTPFYAKCEKIKAKAVLSEWQTDALRSSGANAHIEGDDTTASARTATVRLGNYTQIFKDAVVIPDTDEGLDKAGRTKEMAYQALKIAREQKLDIEKALFDNNARVAGNSSTARELAGAPTYMITNVDMGANEGANATGDGSDARTDETTALTAFTQTKFDSVMQSIWEEGGKPDTCYLSATQMQIALGFVGNNNQRNETSNGKVINTMAVYVTPWGSIQFTPSRENRSRDVFIMQSNMWKVANLRATKNTPLAKTGDSSKRQVVTELTLQACNEKSSGLIADNSV